ncbi:hypothetical protein ACP70R_024807 [Stipagrostis hirtigluma subsp. patula]
MEKPPETAPAAAAEEVAAKFRSLVDAEDVASIRQTQHLIYITATSSSTSSPQWQNQGRSLLEAKLGSGLPLRDNCFQGLCDMFHNSSTFRTTRQPNPRLGRLQDSNAVLTHFNEFSKQCFGEVSSDFASKSRLLKSMKADLDHIFTKLRGMKARLAATYPDAFPDGAMAKTMDQRPDLESPLD